MCLKYIHRSCRTEIEIAIGIEIVDDKWKKVVVVVRIGRTENAAMGRSRFHKLVLCGQTWPWPPLLVQDFCQDGVSGRLSDRPCEFHSTRRSIRLLKSGRNWVAT